LLEKSYIKQFESIILRALFSSFLSITYTHTWIGKRGGWEVNRKACDEEEEEEGNEEIRISIDFSLRSFEMD